MRDRLRNPSHDARAGCRPSPLTAASTCPHLTTPTGYLSGENRWSNGSMWAAPQIEHTPRGYGLVVAGGWKTRPPEDRPTNDTPEHASEHPIAQAIVAGAVERHGEPPRAGEFRERRRSRRPGHHRRARGARRTRRPQRRGRPRHYGPGPGHGCGHGSRPCPHHAAPWISHCRSASGRFPRIRNPPLPRPVRWSPRPCARATTTRRFDQLPHRRAAARAGTRSTRRERGCHGHRGAGARWPPTYLASKIPARHAPMATTRMLPTR